jgi:hypothetical protein
MTKDEIIRMARQAGFSEWAVGLSEMPLHLEAFAKLVEERTLKLLNTEETV